MSDAHSLAVTPTQPGRSPETDIDHELITLAGLLFEASSAVRRQVSETLRDELGIAPEAFEVLLRLSRSPRGRLRMTELSQFLDITTGGTTRMMERLEREGLVRRTPSTSDRRVVYAEVTEKGRSELDRGLARHVDDLHEIFAVRLDAADLADLERGLRALRDAMLGES